MAEMGFEEGIGFIPFAGIGHEVFKTVTKNDSSPLRAAVLEAIALRGDPSLLPKISPALDDEKDVVRFTAAAKQFAAFESLDLFQQTNGR